MDELTAFDAWLASKRTLTEPESLLAKAAFHAAWAAATKHERERCAKLCDEHRGRVPGHCPDKQMDDLVAQGYGNAALNLGVAIRAPSAS